MHVRKLVLLAALILWSVPALADDPAQGGEQNLDISKIMASMAEEMPGGDSPDKGGLPDFDKVTKDMESTKGLFTLWSYPKGTKDKDPEKLLCQIPSGILGQKFMLSTSFSGGGFFTGFPLDERVVKWELHDKQLLLIEPETRFVVNKSKEVSDVVRRTYPDRIRIAVPVVTKSPGGDPLIDFGKLLKSDFADIGWMTRMGGIFGLSGGSGGINASLSQWEGKPKTFPHNVEIGVELAIRRSSPPGSYDKKIIHYSFWALPDSDYKPRIADDRVGYFMTTNQDWSKPTDSRDIFNRYVDRWHLVKRDPSLALCEPTQPITFYIEKTVPVRFRRAVRDGILEWNKAYRKIGFVNAIEVRQQTDDNEWKDLDPEDMRYSFFRWIVTGAGFAMGPHRSNPFTGQIYDADIVFDDSMVRHFEQSAARMLGSEAMQYKAADPTLRDFFKHNPEWQRPTRAWEQFSFGQNEQDLDLREAVRERMRSRGVHGCEYSEGMKHQMAVARTMLAGASKEVMDQFLYDIIKEVVMHEVGHTLGLRHNFKASSIYTLEEIKQRRLNGEATVGSVMDYNPVLFLNEDLPEELQEGYFVTPTIGPYDIWAIEYGYRPFDSNYKGKDKDDEGDDDEEGEEKKAEAKKDPTSAPPAEMKQAATNINLDDIPKEILDQLPPEVRKMIASGDIKKMMGKAGADLDGSEPSAADDSSEPSFTSAPSGEEGMLLEIASRSTEPELAYATDEDTTFLAPDPRVNRFDMGAKPIVWAKARMELVNQRMDNILEWAVKDKESWYYLRSAFLTLTFEKVRVLDFVGRYIGGQYFHRAHRGDKEAPAPFVQVDAQTQREAMSFIEEHAFGDKFFNVPPEVLNHLAPPRWWHEGMSIDFVMDFPVHQIISVAQWWTLFDRLFPNNLRRIHDAEMKTDGSDKFTVAEYIQRLQNSCWGDATNSKRLTKQTWTDANPFVSDVRRSLQREYLGLVEPLVRREPGAVISPDLHAMVQYALKKLSKQLDTVVTAEKADFASQAHLVSCKSRIDRMLAPDLDEYRPLPSFSLFGQQAR